MIPLSLSTADVMELNSVLSLGTPVHNRSATKESPSIRISVVAYECVQYNSLMKEALKWADKFNTKNRARLLSTAIMKVYNRPRPALRLTI